MGGSLSSIFNIEKGFHDETMAKIFLVSLILLFLVVAFVVSLHLYAKWFLRRPFPEHQEQAEPPHSVLPSATTVVVVRRRRTDSYYSDGGRGLDQRVLRSIPVMVLEEGNTHIECAVCLCEVAKGEKYRLLPKCHHGFHVECIDMWFASHATCPICRDSVSVPGLALAKKHRSEVNLDAILETARAENAVMFPTNVLFWGNQTQVSTRQLSTSEEGTTGATSSATVAIDMPRQTGEEDEELSLAVTTRLRSLKRMLNRDRKINPCSPNGDASTQS